MKERYLSKSAEQTQKTAAALAQKLQGGEIISLIGNLGGGKTTFTQGLAKSLNIKDKVSSPTFVIVKKYAVDYKKIKNLYHYDLYRILDAQELIDTGFEEIINDKNNIVVIEWAEKAKSIIPTDRNIIIKFAYKGENVREIIIDSSSA